MAFVTDLVLKLSDEEMADFDAGKEVEMSFRSSFGFQNGDTLSWKHEQRNGLSLIVRREIRYGWLVCNVKKVSEESAPL